MLRTLVLAVVIAIGAASAAPAVAQDYPNRQVSFIVPYAAGGTTDAMA